MKPEYTLSKFPLRHGMWENHTRCLDSACGYHRWMPFAVCPQCGGNRTQEMCAYRWVYIPWWQRLWVWVTERKRLIPNMWQRRY